MNRGGTTRTEGPIQEGPATGRRQPPSTKGQTMNTNDNSVQWFGWDWAAPVNVPELEVPAPAGQPCGSCGEPIDNEATQGLLLAGTPYHLSCHVQTILGAEWAPALFESVTA
jgi:hypothetical protein